ncbi:hypothetical protein EVAR_35967_1 [Eumeta japonica]|uniref:Transmembrane protein n=1 Tax=Eumeta variegata TaxID=151549 RepID=A0A4C1W323_EUMVA|nr:hypothetical protein EVAR_35967_1 [Eumeta japonica]
MRTSELFNYVTRRSELKPDRESGPLVLPVPSRSFCLPDYEKGGVCSRRRFNKGSRIRAVTFKSLAAFKARLAPPLECRSSPAMQPNRVFPTAFFFFFFFLCSICSRRCERP